jgi:hypothetical protein
MLRGSNRRDIKKGSMNPRETHPSSVAWAKKFLKEITPFREWVRQAPRTEAQRSTYFRLVREVALVVAGKRPNVKKFRVVRITVIHGNPPRCKTAGKQRRTTA